MNNTEAADSFDHLVKEFDKAHSVAVAPMWLQIGSTTARIRCTSEMLRSQVRRPLAHLEIPASISPPDFTVDLVDLAMTSAAMPALPGGPHRESAEQQTSEWHHEAFVYTQHGDVMLTGLQWEASRTVGFVRNASSWPLQHYKQAIFITLYQHLRRRGLYLVHASAIAHEGRVALIAGSSGAGKTTTMLSCLQDGFSFLGDDATLLQRQSTTSSDQDNFQVITLLNTLHATEHTLRWFPELEAHASERDSPAGKRLVIVPEAYPGCLSLSGTVHVALNPKITEEPTTRLERVSKAAFLAEMLFYSVDLHEVEGTRRHLDFLAALLEAVPTYRLLLGTDRSSISPMVARSLEKAG